MNSWLGPIAVPLVSGVLGWLGGLLATRYQWNIEKQKLIHQSREIRCREIRHSIDTLPNATDIVHSPFWSQLEKYMSEKDRQQFFQLIAVSPNRGGGGHTPDSLKRQSLFRAIDKIESDWNVV